jgi:hypothetical protein
MKVDGESKTMSSDVGNGRRDSDSIAVSSQ